MNAIDFIELFNNNADFILLDPRNREVFSGSAYRCKAWLMKNAQYDIFPENGGYWADVKGDAVILFLDEIVD